MRISSLLLDLIFPPECLNCGRDLARGAVACDTCLSEVKVHTTLFCGACRSRLAESRKVCHLSFPYVLGAATDYADPVVRNLMHGLKFKGLTRAGDILSGFMIAYLGSTGLPREALVVPIPLGKKRRRQRGFNQAELLATPIAERFGLACDPTVLRRVRDTDPQSELKGEARGKNVAGCFETRGDVAGKKIILVDDVVTSGRTLYEAALTLKNAGAGSVLALAAAKA